MNGRDGGQRVGADFRVFDAANRIILIIDLHPDSKHYGDIPAARFYRTKDDLRSTGVAG